MNGDTPGDAPSQGPQQSAPPPPSGQWQYTPNQQQNAPDNPPPVSSNDTGPSSAEPAELEWTASEFIEHSKSPAWFAILGIVGFVATLGAYFVSRHIVVALMVLATIIIFGVAANRPPRVLTYRIVERGIFIGSQYYPFSDYKSFSIVDEGAFSSITFWPMKRFGFPVGLYYEPTEEERIVTALADHLPLQQHQLDLVERAMRRIRF